MQSYELGDRVQVLMTVCNGTNGYGTIQKISKMYNELFYDIRLDHSVHSVGTLTDVPSIYLRVIVKAIND